MNLIAALALSALVASAALFLTGPSRVLATIALVASALAVAIDLRMMHVAIGHVPLRLVIGLALAIPGVLAWLRASAKTATTAAAILAFVGGLQVVAVLGFRL